MLGAIAGDIIGSAYERGTVRTTDFELFPPAARFTDDSVLTVATADALLNGVEYARAYQTWAQRYPQAGYGGWFVRWMFHPEPEPYGSFGNGSAMRVSPVGWLRDTEAEVLAEATRSAAVTHDHPEGIKGAQAVALAVFVARTTRDLSAVKTAVERRCGYDLSRPWAQVHAEAKWDVTCQVSVPEAIHACLAATGFEDTVRKAVSLGGDADTQAAMAGSIAEALWGVPAELAGEVRRRLPPEMTAVLGTFEGRIG
jgi:ADP-ribosylglycohydrolase